MKYIAQSSRSTLLGAEARAFFPLFMSFPVSRNLAISSRSVLSRIKPFCYPKFSMADEQSYRKEMETQLNELGAQIQDLLNKVGTEVDKEVEALRPKLKAAQEKLDELKQTSTEAWGDLRPGLEKAWSELQKSVGQAAARFKTPRSKNS